MVRQRRNGGIKLEFKEKCCMIIGTGISGIGAATLLYEKGAKITVYDANKKVDRKKVQEKLEKVKATIIIGEFDYDTIASYDLLVISPGVPIILLLWHLKKKMCLYGEKLNLHIILKKVQLSL